MGTYTQRQAAKVVGVSRTTIGRHIAAGRLSATKDDDGTVRIDASELVRCYGGDTCDFERVKKGARPPPNGATATDDDLRKMQDKLESAQEKIAQQYREEVQRLEAALERAQEGQNRVTLMLESHQSKETDWAESIAELRTDAAKQQARLEEEISRLKRVLKSEREKGFWARLVG